MTDFFISYTQVDRPWAEWIAWQLEAAGYTTVHQAWDFRPGGNFVLDMQHAAAESEHTIAVLSPAYLQSGFTAVEWGAAFARDPTGTQGRLLPIRIQDCEPQGLLPQIVYIDLVGLDADAARDTLLAGVQRQRAKPTREPGFPGPSPRPFTAPPLFPGSRSQMLEEVKRYVTSQLAQSLPYAGLIDLRKETRPQQVTLHHEFKGPPQRTRLPPETEILEVFDQERIAGRFLILGAPGVGKTTMLLHLAKELLARAEADSEAPIPVYVNLSSWTDETQPLAHSLAHWLVAELKERYGLRKDIGQRWLEERRILPLLDGLDELPSTRQERCVQAINQFQHEYRPPHLVVCCRLEEFQQSTTKLELNEAIQLLPFTAEQMQRYLVGAGRSDLWQLLQAQPELFKLAQSPLFLSMMTLAFDERAIQELLRESSRDDYRQYLFETYIEHMFSRETRFPGYSKEKTAYRLAWLAQKLQAQAQPEFLLEKLQPTWLLSRAQKWLYHGGVVVSVTLLVQLGTWLLDGLLAFGPPSALYSSLKAMSEHEGVPAHFWPYLELYGGWILPLIVGLLVGMRRAIIPIETLKWSGAKAWQGMTSGLPRWGRLGLKYGSVGGLITGLIVSVLLCLSQSSSTSLSPGSVSWVDVGKIGGLFAGLLTGVVAVMTALPRIGRWGEICERLASQWPRAVLYGLLGGLAVGVVSHVRWVSEPDPEASVMMGLATGMIVGLSHGLSDRRVVRWADTLVVGLLGGVGGGLLSWGIGGLLLKVLPWELENWMHFWLFGGMGVGGAAGLVTGLRATLREKAIAGATLHASRRAGWLGLGLRGRQELTLAAGAAVVSGVLISVLAGVGQVWMVRMLVAFTYFLGWGLIYTLIFCLLCTLGGAAIGAVPSVPGAFFEALRGGLTGEIERRTRPNQGIRQSSGNIGVFALVGGLTVGLLWGLLNLLGTGLILGRAPQAGDWWHFVLGGVLSLGFLSGLIPGAACIQHFILRFVLWCNGVMPWHYVRFLDYATERMFLQRIGGRYRFLHELLRGYFAVMTPKAAIPDSCSRQNCNRNG